MRTLLIPLVLAGCESIDPSGNPFSPVEVSAPAATAAAPVEAPTDPRFDIEEFELSSEELHAEAVAARRGEASPAAAGVAKEPTPAPEATPEPPPEVAAQPAPAPMLAGWPIRLVRTLPDTQPPRAILGLPDGTEIVVHPGSMVPEQGLVVIAVGREQVDLAKITAMGDYASVAPLTLSSL